VYEQQQSYHDEITVRLPLQVAKAALLRKLQQIVVSFRSAIAELIIIILAILL